MLVIQLMPVIDKIKQRNTDFRDVIMDRIVSNFQR